MKNIVPNVVKKLPQVGMDAMVGWVVYTSIQAATGEMNWWKALIVILITALFAEFFELRASLSSK